MRNGPPLFSLVLLSLACGSGLGCEQSADLRLPDPAPSTDLAFGVLYDGDAPQEIGPFVRRQTVYAGRYTLTGGSGLTGRLYFVDSEDLIADAFVVCASLMSAAERLLCEGQITACSEEPAECWQAVTAEQGCGQRLSLGTDVPMKGYEPNGDGRLESSAATPPPGLQLCGPVLEDRCPNRLAGYIVTEAGQFECVASVQQAGCTVDIDASDCGLPLIGAKLDQDGQLQDLVADQCTISAATDSTNGLDTAPDFAFECGEGSDTRTLHFRAQEAILASMDCPTPGPPIFETALFAKGQIVDAHVVRSDDSSQLIISGEGYDECARHGCNLRRLGNCQANCNSDCTSTFFLRSCARDSWASCTEETEAGSCRRRCQEICNSGRPEECENYNEGVFLTLGPTSTPRVDDFRTQLSTLGTARGSPSLASLGGSWLAVASRREVTVFEENSRSLERRGDGFPTTFDLAGTLAIGTNLLTWFGNDGTNGHVQSARIVLGSSSRFEDVQSLSLTDFDGIDTAALGGRQGDWIVLARTSPRLTSMRWTDLRVVEVATNRELRSFEMSGPATALTGLPQGNVLVAQIASDGTSIVSVLAPEVELFRAVASLTLPGGVTVRTMTLEPDSCGGEIPSRCRILLGIEPRHAGRPAMLGALEWNAGTPSELRMMTALQPLSTQQVSRIVIDPNEPRAWAISGYRNRITPMTLER